MVADSPASLFYWTTVLILHMSGAKSLLTRIRLFDKTCCLLLLPFDATPPGDLKESGPLLTSLVCFLQSVPELPWCTVAFVGAAPELSTPMEPLPGRAPAPGPLAAL